MKWRQRKAFKNTQAMRGAMDAGAKVGEHAAVEAEVSERRRKAKEAMEKMLINSKKFGDKIKKNNKNIIGNAAKVKNAIDNRNKGIINGIRDKAEASAAPRKTVRMIGGMFSGGVTAAKGAVDSKNYKRDWNKTSSRTIGGPKKKSTSSRKK